MKIKPITFTDGYKLDHRRQYAPGIEEIYANLTPRNSRIKGIDEVVWFGLQFYIKDFLMDIFKERFFDIPKEKILKHYRRRVDNYLGPNTITLEHIEALHDLGYIPIEIKSLPEGTLVPIGVPPVTFKNTGGEQFAWLVNYLETVFSAYIWKPITSATLARQYRLNFEKYAEITGYDKSFIQWQGHDFSFRGMSGIYDPIMSGAGHLLSFTGTDTIPAIDFLEDYYNADSDKELVGGSVPATEHSVMCSGTKESEFETFKRLITEVYPSGIVSIVSDTWDLWKVLTEYLPALKNEIMNRDGRVVIRPDSGDPVDIICGIGTEKWHCRAIDKGAFEILWDTFGGTINEKGYKELDSHIGLIYGDAITIERQVQILERLAKKGFSANNLVLGIGSFTYEYVTRDTFGMAMKTTNIKKDEENIELFKDPVTDSGIKKSAKGLIQVICVDGKLVMKDQCTPEEEAGGLLQTVFKDGKLLIETSLSEIRQRLQS